MLRSLSSGGGAGVDGAMGSSTRSCVGAPKHSQAASAIAAYFKALSVPDSHHMQEGCVGRQVLAVLVPALVVVQATLPLLLNHVQHQKAVAAVQRTRHHV